MASLLRRTDKLDSPSNHTEKRSGQDRRIHRYPKLKYLLFSGRRANVRRKEDLHHTFYFDRYSSHLFAAIVAILLLSVLDALLTLHLIGRGSTEMNPIMSYFLRYGPVVFMGAKYFLTCFGVVILLLLRNAVRKRSITHAETLFSYIIGAFTTVIVWELYLIFFVVS
jgi:hypothetical protein